MKTVVSLIAKIRTVKGPNEADKGVYNYFFDGEKYGVEEPAGGEGRRYAGPFTLRAQSVLIGNSLTTLFGFESVATSGGEVAYLNNPAFTGLNIGTENPYLAVVYHKDHLGSTRAITKTDGTILEQNDYYPFGLRTTRGENYSTLSESLAAIAQNANNTTANTVVPEYLYNGKEKQDSIKNTSAVINAGGSTDYTSNYIDYGARFYNPTTLRWNTQDPMAEKYQRYSPYNYCVNNPIMLVDPNGEGIFLNNGKVIGEDGIDDGRVYVVKTCRKEFHETDDDEYVKGAGLSWLTKLRTIWFIKRNSGNTEAFKNNDIAYNNSIEIEGNASNRQKMLDAVSQDDGGGGQGDNNNREYGGYIDKNNEVKQDNPGPVSSPTDRNGATIVLSGEKEDSTYHSHASGTVREKEKIYQHIQHPSQADIDDAMNGTHYVFGRRNGNVYVYNKFGIQAVIPSKHFYQPKNKKK